MISNLYSQRDNLVEYLKEVGVSQIEIQIIDVRNYIVRLDFITDKINTWMQFTSDEY